MSCQCASNEYQPHVFLWRIRKISVFFYLKNQKRYLIYGYGHTPQPLYNMVRYNMVLYITRFNLIVLGFNDTSTLEGHFVSSPREREKRDRRESRGDEREGQGRKRNRNESEETEEIKTFPLYPYPLQG